MVDEKKSAIIRPAELEGAQLFVVHNCQRNYSFKWHNMRLALRKEKGAIKLSQITIIELKRDIVPFIVSFSSSGNLDCTNFATTILTTVWLIVSRARCCGRYIDNLVYRFYYTFRTRIAYLPRDAIIKQNASMLTIRAICSSRRESNSTWKLFNQEIQLIADGTGNLHSTQAWETDI